MNYKQLFTIQRKNEKLIADLFNIPHKTGIYLFHRLNEDGKKCYYVGQAKDLLKRVAQHLSGRKTHIDKSIFKHKLYPNEYGWKVNVLEFCDETQLDRIEQYWIDRYMSLSNVVIYNVTGGGQRDKKKDINKRQQSKLKSYANGKLYGYNKAIDEVRIYFDKYLDFKIKGKETKIKQKKYKEFEELMND